MLRIEAANPALGIPVASPASSPRAPQAAQPFSTHLAAAMEGAKDVRFSNHAMQRLRERNITLNDAQLGAIRDAVDQAAAKGGRESLLLMQDLALVASVPNRTVITAMHTGEASANVFTNIDSAVVVPAVG
jgi:flagellar operon protein